jgi:hypothetical protein
VPSVSDGFRTFNARFIVPFAMTLMILGFIFLCQPWNDFLHDYSVVITLTGLLLFTVFARFAPAPAHFAPAPDPADASDHG